MDPAFWNDRFGPSASEYVYGRTPNAFVQHAQAEHLAPGASVLELGAGEGRNAVFLAAQGFTVTALDYAEEGLAKARRLASERGVVLETVQADVTQWHPSRTWDAVVVTFLHLPTAHRRALYERIHEALVPGGVLVAEWFHPRQVTEGYTSGGPPSEALMITLDELRQHFDAGGILAADEAVTHLDEGPHHRGPAAVTRLVWRRTQA